MTETMLEKVVFYFYFGILVLYRINEYKNKQTGVLTQPSSKLDLTKPLCSLFDPVMKQDYCLSKDISLNIEKGSGINQDLFLESNPNKDCGTLSGRVLNVWGDPIKNALIMVFDLDQDPLINVLTNEDGEFLICLPVGRYIIKAAH